MPSSELAYLLFSSRTELFAASEPALSVSLAVLGSYVIVRGSIPGCPTAETPTQVSAEEF